MKRFLRTVHSSKRDERPTCRWDGELSVELRTALVVEGILDQAPRARMWECGGGGFDGCPRRIVPNKRGAETPYLAVCGAGNQCGDVPLSQAETEQLGTSFERLVDVLRDRLGIAGRGQDAPSIFPDTFAIGTIARGERVVDALLALNAGSKTFPHFLATRTHRDTVAFVSSARWVPDALLARHGPGARVELVLLEDVLQLSAGRIVARPQWAARSAAASSAATDVAPLHVARLYTERGNSAVSAAQADEIATRMQEFDLFIDGVHAQSKKRGGALFAASTRRDGRRHEVRLTGTDAAVLSTLVARRVPLRAKEIPALNGMRTAARILERARQAIEKEAPWRWFLTRRGLSPDLKTFVFSPPPGATYAVLVPLAPLAATKTALAPK